MKRLMMAAAVAALAAGCAKNEAERFGYRGADVSDDDKMFFTTGLAVTNWVPARVLSVCEEYPMSPDETAVIAAAGVITPSDSFEKVPDGYAKASEEPWFVTWTKESENFGRKGVNGFISHWNEDKNVWETSETYFSSYYPDESAALVALAETRKAFAEKYSPKRFHDFDKCWIAEYLRLRVMCLVGQKPDGTWSCMLDINDKCRPGCGQWESVEMQAERLADYKYRKAMAAWKAEKAKLLEENHAAVEKIRAEKGLSLLGEGSREFDGDDGRKAYVRVGTCDAASVKDKVDFWKEKAAALAVATGVSFEGEPTVEEDPSGYVVIGALATNEIYDVRLDMAFPPAAAASEGENAEEEPSPKPPVEWRELCVEKMQPGLAIPPRPQPPRR